MSVFRQLIEAQHNDLRHVRLDEIREDPTDLGCHDTDRGSPGSGKVLGRLIDGTDQRFGQLVVKHQPVLVRLAQGPQDELFQLGRQCDDRHRLAQ